MNQIAVFVDAGYVFAAGAMCATGSHLRRSELHLNVSIVSALIDYARELSEKPLLRVYWYDGAMNGPTAEQLVFAKCDNVKLRLGFINSNGQQKGVDSLIITDLITLARNGAITDALLVSGDEDLRVGVQLAQEFGVRVHLLGIGESNQSLLLQQESDTLRNWDTAEITQYLSVRTQPAPQVPLKDPIDTVVAAVLGAMSTMEREVTLQSVMDGTGIPHDQDSELLRQFSTLMTRSLSVEEKRELRKRFKDALARTAN